MKSGLLGFTKKAMAFWRARFGPIESNTRRTATATEGIHASRGRTSGLVIEGSVGGEPVPVTLADESSDNSVSSEQLPFTLGPNGGMQIEGIPDGMPVAVTGVVTPPMPAPAVWATGRLAFGSITSSYVLVLALTRPAAVLAFFNSTNTEVVISFDNGTAHAYMPASSTQTVDLRVAGLSEARSVYLKHNGTAPGSGAFVANAVS